MTIKVAPKKRITFKQRLKDFTGRSLGISLARRLTDLARYVRGWVGYVGLARQFEDIANLDGWLKRRIRMCYWKQWRYPRTKIKHLVGLGVTLDMAVKHAISRKQYWRMSGTPTIRFAMTNEWPCVKSLRATRLGVIKATLARGFSSRNRTVWMGAKADPHARWCEGAVSNGGGYPISGFRVRYRSALTAIASNLKDSTP